MTTMPTRRLGGLQVSAIGLGEMPMSLAGRPDEAQSIRTIHAALDAGVTLIDTADAYCIDETEVGHGERLVAKALAAWPGDCDRVVVATKGGHTREGGEWNLDGRPEQLRQACEASLRALGVGAIGLYQFHRPDPKVPFAESVGTMAELKDAGKVRLVGLSNVSVDQIRQARRRCSGRPSSSHSPPGRVWPPLVATSTRSRSPGQVARASATRRSPWPTSDSSMQ